MTDTPSTGPDTTQQTVTIGPRHLQNVLIGSIFKVIAGTMEPAQLTAIASAASAYSDLGTLDDMQEQLATLQFDMKLMAMRSPAQRNA